MIPPNKCFEIFPPDWGILRRSRRVLIFLETLSLVFEEKSERVVGTDLFEGKSERI